MYSAIQGCVTLCTVPLSAISHMHSAVLGCVTVQLLSYVAGGNILVTLSMVCTDYHILMYYYITLLKSYTLVWTGPGGGSGGGPPLFFKGGPPKA